MAESCCELLVCCYSFACSDDSLPLNFPRSPEIEKSTAAGYIKCAVAIVTGDVRTEFA